MERRGGRAPFLSALLAPLCVLSLSLPSYCVFSLSVSPQNGGAPGAVCGLYERVHEKFPEPSDFQVVQQMGSHMAQEEGVCQQVKTHLPEDDLYEYIAGGPLHPAPSFRYCPISEYVAVGPPSPPPIFEYISGGAPLFCRAPSFHYWPRRRRGK